MLLAFRPLLLDAGMRRQSVRDRRIGGRLEPLGQLLLSQSGLRLAPFLAAFLDLGLGATFAAGFTTGGNGVVADSLQDSFAGGSWSTSIRDHSAAAYENREQVDEQE